MNDELAARFPDMRPINGAPTLALINFCGLTVYGGRDYDSETGTYVKTHVLCVLFVPIFALGAYRVADSHDGGWYFIGRVPLSGLAVTWNWLVALLIAGGIGYGYWNAHTRTPEYQAGQALVRAETQMQQGQTVAAIAELQQIIQGNTSHAAAASQLLAQLLENPPAARAPTTALFHAALDLHRQNRCPVPDLYAVGSKLAKDRSTSDPVGALEVLELVSPIAPDRQAEAGLRLTLLEALVAQEPTNLDYAARLALLLDAAGKNAAVEKLLLPFADKLGTTDAAGLLGRCHARQGRWKEALALLQPLVAARLPALHTAEQLYENTIKQTEDALYEQLRSGHAPGFDYDAHKRSFKTQQDALVQTYLRERLQNDANLRAARDGLMKQSMVVNLALELALVQLQAASQSPDPAARKSGFQAAEKTFLSIKTFAGESETYKLYLGQVYHWLNRPKEGDQLFEELLAKRVPATMIAVAKTLREVGALGRARALVEAAYDLETDGGKKQNIANFRAIMSIDLDDQLKWLNQSNHDLADVRANLATLRAQKAQIAGNEAEAATQYRQALTEYASMPESTATLNNSALVHFSLARITNDAKEFARGMDKLDRAIQQKPTDSILFNNSVHVLVEGALRATCQPTIDTSKLARNDLWDCLTFLAPSEIAYRAKLDQLAQHPGCVRAMGYAQKLVLLAPQNPSSYHTLAELVRCQADLAGQRDLLSRLQAVKLDQTEAMRQQKDFLAGTEDAKLLEPAQTHAKQAEAAVTACRKANPTTFAVAIGQHCSAQIALFTLGQSVDSAALLKLAEEAHQAAPSLGTRRTIEQVLQLRVHERFSKQNAEYGKLVQKTKRALNLMLAYELLARSGPLTQALLADADVIRLRKMALEDFQAEPQRAPLGDWPLLRWESAAVQQQVVKALQSDESARIRRATDALLSPPSATQVLRQVWLLRATGQSAEAEKLLRKAASDGLPMPN
jgi:hypothetical protein